MSKGGHNDPSQLSGIQKALIGAPITGHYMSPYPLPAPMMSSNPGLFGLSGVTPPPVNVSQLNFGNRPVAGPAAPVGGPVAAPRGNPSLWNPWGFKP